MSDKKNHGYPYDEESDMELFNEMFPVSSSTDCTGLIPTAVTEDAELNSYGQIYDIPLSKDEQQSLHHEKKNPEAPGISETSRD